jgi:hypothetical protein
MYDEHPPPPRRSTDPDVTSAAVRAAAIDQALAEHIAVYRAEGCDCWACRESRELAIHLGESWPVLQAAPRTWHRPRPWRVAARHAAGGFLLVVLAAAALYALAWWVR